MKKVLLEVEAHDNWIAPLKKEKRHIDETYYDELICGPEDVEVLKPNGQTLFKVIRKVIPAELTEVAFNVFQKAYTRGSASYRGVAAGQEPDREASSVTLGSLDRTARHGIKPCRETTFSLRYPGDFAQAIEYIGAVDGVFRQHMPRHWFYQRFAAMYTTPDYVLGESSFSTIAINQNFRTAVHTDEGDLKGSFGVLTCFKRGPFTGGELIFPKYRIAVDFADGDVLLANVHEAHGNAPIVAQGDYTRLSAVFYFRERILQCGTFEEEMAFLERRKPGDPLFGWLLDGDFHPDRKN